MRIKVPTAGSRNMCWTIKYKWHLKTHQRDARCSIRSAISRLSKSTAISWAVLPLIVRDKSAPAFRSISAMSKWPTTVSYLHCIWMSNIAQEIYTYSFQCVLYVFLSKQAATRCTASNSKDAIFVFSVLPGIVQKHKTFSIERYVLGSTYA